MHIYVLFWGGGVWAALTQHSWASKARLVQEMKKDGVSQNSLFLERYVCYALGMQLDQSKILGAEALREQVQGLPAEAGCGRGFRT